MHRRDEKFPDNGFEAWGGYMQAKIAKLENQFFDKTVAKKLSNIFEGVSIYVNGFTKPSADELKDLMSLHGGVYHTYQRSDDYIIASNLPDTKVKNMSLVRVVKPEWIVESIASNRLLDYKEYLLYKNSRTQPQLNFNKIVLKQEPSVFRLLGTESYSKMNESEFTNEQQKKLIKSFSGKEEVKSLNKSEDSPQTMLVNEVTKTEFGVKTAVDPTFISEFYNNSRLHHISQLGACFKQHINYLREGSNFSFPARSDLKSRILSLNNTIQWSQNNFDGGKIIMHIDMDCFFVSVGLRKRPDLLGKPVAVTHSKGGQNLPKRAGVDRHTEFNLYKQKETKRLEKAIGKQDISFESRVDKITDDDDVYGSMSEIASCSYEARAKGITNGMFMGAALRLCPDLLTIPYDFEGYKDIAYILYNTVAQYTLDIEAVSCDEMYVDCTDTIKELGVSVQDFATVLRDEIKFKTGCTCSTGFGGNRLQARLATKRAKPNGQFFLTAELVEEFMFNINLRDLPGVGKQTAQKLESLGHQTCGSLQTLTLGLLQRHMGNKTGSQLFNHCRGYDPIPLTFYTVRKSVSAEVNYGIRFENNEQCIDFLKQLSAEIQSRMQQFKVLGKCVTLKLMVRAEDAPVETAKFMGHGFCNIINKSTLLPNSTNNIEIITKEVISLFKKQKINPKEMRGIGIQISKLEPLVPKRENKGVMNKFLKQTNNNTLTVTTNKTVNIDSIKPKTDVQFKFSTTPNKNMVTLSPVKIKPKLGLQKSPGKRKGRPPKLIKNKYSTSNQVMNKFLFGQNQNNDEILLKNEIKEEAICPKINDELKPQGLFNLPWEKVRDLLRAWLESGQSPKFYDTNMIATYLSKMVVNKDIDKVYVLLNFLRRRTCELEGDNWLKVYEYILNEVQSAMITVYGKKMWV